MDKFSILTPIAEPTSCGYHRVTIPFDGMVNKRIDKDSVLFFNRVNKHENTHRFFLDLDDYWILPKTNPHYLGWQSYKMPQRIVSNIKNAIAVFVTNQRLADKVFPYNKNVHIIPNALPFDKGQFTRTVQGNDFVFAGGVSHSKDIELIKGIECKYYGGLKGSRSYPLTNYMKAYDNKLASLVPLLPGEFNECKSNLKILEAGAKGIGCIASKVHPYDNDLDKDVMFYGFDKLPSKDELKSQGLALSEHVRKNYHLDLVNKERFSILAHYLERL